MPGVALISKTPIRFLILATVLVASAIGTFGQQTNPTRPPDPAAARQAPAAGFQAPGNIDFRSAVGISESVRLPAELFSLKSLAGKSLPTILLGPGWGRHA